MREQFSTLSVHCLDGDGCLLNPGESSQNFLERNNALIEDIIQRSKDATLTLLISSSNRQFFNTELFASAKNKNGIQLISLQYIKDELQKRGLKNVIVDDFLLEDIFSNATHGTAAQKIYSALGIQDKNEIKTPAASEQIPSFSEIYKNPSLLFKDIKFFFDDNILSKYKIFILYAIHHKIRQDYPEHNIRSVVYDDSKNILFGANFFNQKLPFFPPHCTVDFCLYDHSNNIHPTVQCTATSDEKALADANYPSTIIHLTQLSTDISKKEYIDGNVDDFLYVLDLSKISPLVKIMYERDSEKQNKDKILTHDAEKLLLNLYIKMFSSCPDLEKVVARFKNLLNKEENDFLLKIAKNIYDIIQSPQIISYDAYEKNASILKQRDSQLFDLIQILKEKSQTESNKLIILQGDISKNINTLFPGNYNFLMFLKKWASTHKDVPDYVMQLFLELRTDSSPEHLLNRMRFVYLPMIVKGQKEFFSEFKMAYKTLLKSVPGSEEAEQHFNYMIRFAKLRKWVGMNHSKTYGSDFNRFLSWLDKTVGCQAPQVDYIFKWIKGNKIFSHVNNILEHMEQLFVCTEENKKREALISLKDSLSTLAIHANQKPCPQSDFQISESCKILSDKIKNDLQEETFKIDKYRIPTNHPFFKMPMPIAKQYNKEKTTKRVIRFCHPVKPHVLCR